MIQCSVCGEKLREKSNYCPSCGASLISLFANESTSNEVSKKNLDKGTKGNNKTKTKTDKIREHDSVKEQSKNISMTKLMYMILVLFFIGAVIVISSGIFEKPIVTSQLNQGEAGHDHGGVDLSNLEHINTLEEAVKKNPNDKESLLHLAHLLNDSGFKEKAIDKYKQYLKIDSQNADVLVDMGVCYYETGKNLEAISYMEKALKYQPKHQIAHLNLGIVNMSAGNMTKAKEWWNKAVAINPTNDIGKRAAELLKSH